MDNWPTIRPVWAEIDLDALTHNVREVRRITSKSTKIMAVVKADAYGHGAIPISKIFLNNGADSLGVANLTEAIELRRAGIDSPILNLGYTPTESYGDLLANRVTATIYDVGHAHALDLKSGKLGVKSIVHVKIDTGMNRLGFKPNAETIRAIKIISKMPNIELEGIFTHFAVSDTDKNYTGCQFKLFTWILNELSKVGVDIPVKHVSNSAAIIDLPEYALDMVRPGIMLYGYRPSSFANSVSVMLKPAMSLKARLSNVKTVTQGVGISYGLTYTTHRPSIIGTIPIGYADGYRRALSNKGWASINGKKASVIGQVCMDQCMIDLTDHNDAKIGDEVILFGGGAAPSVEETAKLLDTIVHEVICGISRRVPRVYLKKLKPVEVRDYLLA
jgi:alanine racemase